MDGEQGSGASVYRFYAADQLVYLGVTGQLPKRLDDHSGRDWWRSCDRLTLAHYPTREEAAAAETVGIRAERPLYNVVHNYYIPPAAGGEDTTMETITSRSFQISYQRLEIPVVVKAKSRTLGTWYPKGTEPATGLEMQALLRQRDDAIAEAHALRRKIEMPDKTGAPVMKPTANVRAKVPTQVQVGTASYSSRPFTPVPHPGKGK